MFSLRIVSSTNATALHRRFYRGGVADISHVNVPLPKLSEICVEGQKVQYIGSSAPCSLMLNRERWLGSWDV